MKDELKDAKQRIYMLEKEVNVKIVENNELKEEFDSRKREFEVNFNRHLIRIVFYKKNNVNYRLSLRFVMKEFLVMKMQCIIRTPKEVFGIR